MIQQQIAEFQVKLTAQQRIAGIELKSLSDFTGGGSNFDLRFSRQEQANQPILSAREFVSGAPDILEGLNIQLQEAQTALTPVTSIVTSNASTISPTVIFAGLAILGVILFRK